MIEATRAFSAQNDGYTLLTGTTTAYATNPSVFKNTAYNPSKARADRHDESCSARGMDEAIVQKLSKTLEVAVNLPERYGASKQDRVFAQYLAPRN
ncbi:MAG: hypothetical protein L0I29_16940 [Hyphomicrobiales bacterium]|nr:hypothetical protein [Hyphomicrobiales bacterium]